MQGAQWHRRAPQHLQVLPQVRRPQHRAAGLQRGGSRVRDDSQVQGLSGSAAGATSKASPVVAAP